MADSYPNNAYEGASQSFRMSKKGLRFGSPEAVSARELRFLRARSQHLIRNSGGARSAQMKLTSNIVGEGIKVKWSDERLQKLWAEFEKRPSLDIKGTLGNQQALWANGTIESGEIFTRMLIKKRPGHTIPLALQTFEADQLDPAFIQNNNIRNGIEFDKYNFPKKYHFWERHPSTVYNIYAPGNSQNRRIAVDAADVIHIFEQLRPGQWRGVPWFAPIITTLYDMEELNDATLVRQKAAQAIGWIIKKVGSGALPSIGGMSAATVHDTVTQGGEDEEAPARITKVTPAGVHYLEEGEDFEFASVQDIGDNYVKLLKQYWRTVASSLGLTYEQLTGDLTDVNFSSIRAGLIEFRKRLIQVQHLLFLNQALVPLTDRFQELATALTPHNFTNAKASFVLPKLHEVDRLKDVQADILEIRGGLSTVKKKLAERSEDFDGTLDQLIVEQGLDVVLDTNPRHNTKDVVKVDEEPKEPVDDKPTEKTDTEDS